MKMIMEMRVCDLNFTATWVCSVTCIKGQCYSPLPLIRAVLC